MTRQGAWDGGGDESPGPGWEWGGGFQRQPPHPKGTSLFFCQDYLDALAGICYDGLEGLLFLGLFSLLAALAFSTMICIAPRAWKHFATRWAAGVQVRGGVPGGAGRRL